MISSETDLSKISKIKQEELKETRIVSDGGPNLTKYDSHVYIVYPEILTVLSD